MSLRELDYPFDAGMLLRSRKRLKKQLAEQPGLIHKKIAILSGSTVGEIEPMLELFLLNQGIQGQFFVGSYNRFYEDAVYGNPALKAFEPDYIYLHTTCRNIPAFPEPDWDGAAAARLEEQTFLRFRQVWEAIQRNFGCCVIQNNFDPLPYRLLGNGDGMLPGGGQRFLRNLNQRMAAYGESNRDFYINDLEFEAALMGLDRWFDPAQWYHYKYALSMDAIPLLCFNVANIIKATLGKNKKALALDLDNTLWGGVVGDDGVENLQMGMETPRGMAFSELQGYLRALSRTGVALNVCSKNEPAAAKSGFTHPGARLKEEDFVTFFANWEHKEKNVAAILSALNVMPDSLVFLDDNPVERDRVGSAFPEAALLDAGDPEATLLLLDRRGYFEATTITGDDRVRNQALRENLEREQARTEFEDETEYLRSLNMHGEMMDLSPQNAPRVTQLVNKTNQFNLTTRRYTEPEVKSLMGEGAGIAFCARLYDKFGDNGIVTALFAHVAGDTATIDLWVMSCRVFRRGLEQAVMAELADRCRARGVKQILGRYVPSPRNGLVRDLYASLGFALLEEKDGERLFGFDLSRDTMKPNTVIAVEKGMEKK